MINILWTMSSLGINIFTFPSILLQNVCIELEWPNHHPQWLTLPMSFETPKKFHKIFSIFGQKVHHQQVPFIYHVMITIWLKSWSAIRQTWSVIKHTLNVWSNMGQWIWSCIALASKKQLELKNLSTCSEVITLAL
jgi:hypothetical protein